MLIYFPQTQWVLAIDLERGGSHPEADCKILIKDQHLDSLVAQEEQVLAETKEALGGEFHRFIRTL